MKALASAIRVFSFLVLCTISSAYAADIRGKVIEAAGGNVLTVRDGSRLVKVRLVTIVPPKPGHPLAEVVRKHLSDLTLDKLVTVTPIGPAQDDGSIPGLVSYEGHDVGVQMVRDGAASYDSSYGGKLDETTRLLYEQSEQAARSEKRGLWAEPTPTAAGAAVSGEDDDAAPQPTPQPERPAPGAAPQSKPLTAVERARQLNDAAYYSIKMHQYAAAVPLLTQAVQLDKSNADVHKNICIVLVVLDKPKEALAECQEAIRLRPVFDKAYQVSGQALHKLGRKEEALRAYRQAIRINPRYAKAYHNLGFELLDMGRYNEAVAAFLQAERLGFEAPGGLNVNLGLALYRLGRREEARERWRRALTSGEPDAAALALNNLRLP